jgi:hypothetical protein
MDAMLDIFFIAFSYAIIHSTYFQKLAVLLACSHDLVTYFASGEDRWTLEPAHIMLKCFIIHFPLDDVS